MVVSVNPSQGEAEPEEELTLDQKAEQFAKTLRRNGQYTFDTRSSNDLNIEMKWPREGDFQFPAQYDSPSLLASRSFSGYGQERGQMELTLRNREAIRERRVTYFEVLPWFIKPYLHTLSVQVEADEYDKSFLRYAQHPPDAHRGFDVAPAAIIAEDGSKIYTNPSLIEVAVPDFSMPYNVM